MQNQCQMRFIYLEQILTGVTFFLEHSVISKAQNHYLNELDFDRNHFRVGEVNRLDGFTTMYGIMTIVHGPKTIFYTGWSNCMKTKFIHS